MLITLLELMLTISLLCLILLAFHRSILKHTGAHNTYALWCAVPLVLLGSLIGKFSPQLLSIDPLQAIQRYRVVASEVLIHSTQQLANDWLAALWLVGSLIMICGLIYQGTCLHNLLRHSKTIAPDMTTNHITNEATLAVKTHPNIHSPMLVGILRPVILVPQNFTQLSESQRQSILAHEQHHHNRHDILTNLFAYLLVSLFWFNPIFWLAYRRFRDDQELACDAQVTKKMNTNEKIAYSQTLLAYSQQAQMGMLHTHYGNKTILKERIMQMKKQHGKSTLAILGLTLSLGISGALINQSATAGDTALEQTKQHIVAPVTRIEPRYPTNAINQKIEGYVQLEFDISQDGKVINVSVIKSSPAGIFDEEAIKALSQWTYEPSANGVNKAQVQLDFRLEPPKAELERVLVTAG